MSRLTRHFIEFGFLALFSFTMYTLFAWIHYEVDAGQNFNNDWNFGLGASMAFDSWWIFTGFGACLIIFDIVDQHKHRFNPKDDPESISRALKNFHEYESVNNRRTD